MGKRGKESYYSEDLARDVVEAIAEGTNIVELHGKFGVSRQMVWHWSQDDSKKIGERTFGEVLAEARSWGIEAMLVAAEEQLRTATTTVEVQKAREALHHARWKAAKLAGGRYGDRVAIDHSGEVQTKPADYMPDWLRSKVSGTVPAELDQSGPQPGDAIN